MRESFASTVGEGTFDRLPWLEWSVPAEPSLTVSESTPDEVRDYLDSEPGRSC